MIFLFLACPDEPKDSGSPVDTADTADRDTGDTADTADTSETGDTADTGDDSGDTATERACDDVVAEFVAETASIRACADASDCGQVLEGTSCGCTQDWVARADADTTEFYALLAEGSALACDMGTVSDCSCPEVAGYDCVDEVCTWNYVGDYVAYPACDGATGYATTVDSVTLVGDSLSVLVSYGGGCAEHWFSTCWPDQAFMESWPVQASLDLLHEASEPDACDAWMSEEVTVDLVPLRDAYVAAYGSTGTIVVSLEGYSVEYSF